MMSWQLYLAFVAAVATLIAIPGPNVALIVANSVAYGTRFGVLTVAGTSTAVLIILGLTALSLTAVLGTLAAWFEWIRWAGVAYLIWLGIRQWRAPAADLTRVSAQPRSVRSIFVRGFVVSLTNPKNYLFFSAFFPQFLTAGENLPAQMVLLSVTFYVVSTLLDGVWALAAGRVRGVLASRGTLRNRVSGGLLMGAGLGLALARNK